MKEAIENVMIQDGGFKILFKAYCIAGLIVCAILVIYFTSITIREAMFMHDHKKNRKRFEKEYEEYKGNSGHKGN